ncbi:uncharacterized protein LOC108671725 [Hyalella azteca]|uniref:Uncharacterized protein LOC108671725 n=1 Tax=Hyalella azteca TaxID=294128 RepID=A0A8B7NM77_HYAAZ|nr:uncharacterized protein LOC108671725 [Hyalella azteca]
MKNWRQILVVLLTLLALQVTGLPIHNDDPDNSCSQEKLQAMLAKCQSPLDDVTRVITKFPDGQQRCGYRVLNIFPDPHIVDDESLVALKEEKKKLPPCSKCETKVFLLNGEGNVIQGPVTEREFTEPGAPQAVSDVNLKAENDQAISVGWRYPLPDCPLVSFSITYERFDLNDLTPPRELQTFVVNGLTHRLSNVEHHSLYEICITTLIGEEKSTKTCAKIPTQPKTFPAPSNLELIGSTSSSLTVAWEPPEGVEVVNYKLTVAEAQLPDDIERNEYKLEGPKAQLSTLAATTYTLPAELHSYTIKNLRPGYKYRIGVKTVDASGSESNEAGIFVSTNNADGENSGKEGKSTAPSPPESTAETDGSQGGGGDIVSDKTYWVIIALSIVASILGIVAFIFIFAFCCCKGKAFVGKNKEKIIRKMGKYIPDFSNDNVNPAHFPKEGAVSDPGARLLSQGVAPKSEIV